MIKDKLKSTLKNFLLLFLILIVHSCVAQSTPVNIKILNSNSKDLKFQVENNSNELYYYYIGLEQQDGNNWVEIVLDIKENAPLNATLVRTIHPWKTHQCIYKKLNIPKDYLNISGLFRFKVTYHQLNDKVDKEIYSKSFKGN